MRISPNRQKQIVLVKLFLLCSHVDTEDLLHFGGERLLHVLFDSAEQERLEDFVEAVVTIISAFPVVVLKVLPGIKPVVRNSKMRQAGLLLFGVHLDV